MPARTERYRFTPWEIEDVNGISRKLPGGYANVTHGGGMKYDQVVFLGPDNTIREEFHLEAVCRGQAQTSSVTRRLMRLDRMETKAIPMKATRCSFVRSKIVFNRR